MATTGGSGLHIQVIVGSIREGRMAGPVADWVCAAASERTDLSVELIDLKEWALPMFDLARPPIMGDYEDPLQRRWADTIAKGDGYLLVSPEYNHGYSSVLKNALDYLYGEWVRKPVSHVSYGSVNGARNIEQLRLVAVELQMAPLREALHIVNVWGKVSEGRFNADPKELKQLQKVLDELVWWGGALQRARAER